MGNDNILFITKKSYLEKDAINFLCCTKQSQLNGFECQLQTKAMLWL